MNFIEAQKEFVETKYSNLYFRICKKYKLEWVKGDGNHKHHFLPKSMFPEYTDLKVHTWNCVCVNPRVHFLLHYVLYKHFKNTGDIVNATSNLRAVLNFSKNSKKYETFRKLHSKTISELWKDDQWSTNTKKLMSEAAKKRYESKDLRIKTSESMKNWHKNRNEDTFNETRNKISTTILNKYKSGELNSDKKTKWRNDNPELFLISQQKMKETINSDEYKKEKWKKCEHCDIIIAPGNYKKYHGEYCKNNPLGKSRLKTCVCCNKSFGNIGQHFRHNKTCKDFNGKR